MTTYLKGIFVLKMPNIVYFSYVSNNNGLVEFSFIVLCHLLLMISIHPSNIDFKNILLTTVQTPSFLSIYSWQLDLVTGN